eukprot:360766-Chlamydomonas_euryale.AAC.3
MHRITRATLVPLVALACQCPHTWPHTHRGTLAGGCPVWLQTNAEASCAAPRRAQPTPAAVRPHKKGGTGSHNTQACDTWDEQALSWLGGGDRLRMMLESGPG